MLVCLVPLVGLVELALHAKQTGPDVVPDEDWIAAREALKAEVGPDDLVLFEPFWVDPIGRRFFGDALAPMQHEARPDESRFARVFEVSIRGKRDEALARWHLASERKVGAITVRLLENPSPVKVETDLLARIDPEHVNVSRIDGNGVETPCTWQRGAGQPGGLGVPQGPAIPGDKFNCSGGFVGAAVLHAVDHHPHLCLFTTLPGNGGSVRIKFSDVAFGEYLHGHDGVQWVTERTPSNERINLAFSAFDRPIGEHTHKVGAGWIGFEFPTPELAGKRGELVAEIRGGNGGQRHFCFEADTR